MRILIDLQCCQSGSRLGGIGRYSMSLAKAMLRLGSGHQFALLLNSRLPYENAIRAEFADLLPQQHIHAFALPSFVAGENELPAHTRIAELIREKHIAEIAPDVLHIASFFEGAGDDAVTSAGSLFPAARTVVTLYDLIPFLDRQTYFRSRALRDYYLAKFEQLKAIGLLLSISDFSRMEALQHAGVSPDRIVNVSSAVDGQFAPREIDDTGRRRLLGKFGIERPFVLFTSRLESRKNHERLVEAFAAVLPSLAKPCQLVIVGKGEPRQVARLHELAKEHGLGERDLVVVGHVSDDELVALYNLCTLFVFPSLREGFGLPVLEAMSCGAATIGADNTSVPEVIDWADALFDPQSVGAIAARMREFLGDEVRREELARHGLQRARMFSWEQSARRALDAIEAMHGAAVKDVVEPAPAPVDDRDSMVYTEFLNAVAGNPFGRPDAAFLEAAARCVALNELALRALGGGASLPLNAGWVTSWAQGCELASYSMALLRCIPAGVVLFAPHLDGRNPIDRRAVQWSWDARGDEELAGLNAALAASVVDVVIVQAGKGMFKLGPLAQLVDRQHELGRQVFITFHSTEDFLRVPAPDAAAIRASFKRTAAIFVHEIQDVETLERFGIRSGVNIIPLRNSFGSVEGSSQEGERQFAAHYLGKLLVAMAAASSA